MSDKKRAYDGPGEPANKKLKSDTPAANGSKASTPPPSSADIIAKKRAEITAKLAAMRNQSFGITSPATTLTAGVKAPIPLKLPPSLPAKVTATSSFISSGPTPATDSPVSSTGTPTTTEDLARRVAEAKRRVADAQSKLAVKDNPYMSMSQPGKKKGTPVEQMQQGAGLKMAAHPLLLDQMPSVPQSKKDRYKPMQPKFASIKANTRNIPTPPPAPAIVATSSPSTNPYASGSLAPKDAGTGFEGAPRERAGRNFRFNPKGKYTALANQMRQDNQLEALKQRIAESARKAGLDGDMGIEKTIKRPPPPESEWWDATFLPNKRYDDVDTLGVERLNITTVDSPITIYIQHPIPIPAPGDKNKVELKPMMLTKKEQKKMRKLRRKEILQDKRDRIRMGLLPPDPPKVRLANLMKVLTSDAVQDPTRVEARVRREVALRKHTHEKANAERKLTDDQRRDKLESKKLDEDRRGIYGAVFKVKNLSDPAHQFKIRKNAEQLNLTGVCILNKQFNLVYVEGAAKFMKNYKRLMLQRIAWTEAARPRHEDVVLENPDSDIEGDVGGPSSIKAPITSGDGLPAAPAAESAVASAAVSLEDNRCFLVWEGSLRERSFGGFKTRSCPTDRDAKDLLGDRIKGYWDAAKNWKPEEEELF